MTISSPHCKPYLYQRYISPFLESNAPSCDLKDAEKVLKIVGSLPPLEVKTLLAQTQRLFSGSTWPVNQKINLLLMLAPHSDSVRVEHILLTLKLSHPGQWDSFSILSTLKILLETDSLIKRDVVLDTLKFTAHQIESASQVIDTLRILKNAPYLNRSRSVSDLCSQLPRELSLKIANRFLKIFVPLFPIERRYILKKKLIETTSLFVTSKHSSKEISSAIEILSQISPKEREPKIKLIRDWIAKYGENNFTAKEQNEILNISHLLSLESAKILLEKADLLFLGRTSEGNQIIEGLKILACHSLLNQEKLIDLTIQIENPQFSFSQYTIRVMEILSKTITRKELIQDFLTLVQKFSSPLSFFEKSDTLELLANFSNEERSIISNKLIAQIPEDISLSSINVLLKLLFLLEPREKEIFFKDHFISHLLAFSTPNCWEEEFRNAFDLLAKTNPLERTSLIAALNGWLPKIIDVKSKTAILEHYLELTSGERDLLRHRVQDWDYQKRGTEAFRVICEIHLIKAKRDDFKSRS